MHHLPDGCSRAADGKRVDMVPRRVLPETRCRRSGARPGSSRSPPATLASASKYFGGKSHRGHEISEGQLSDAEPVDDLR